jgi:hemerythrin-like domain-containing protein
VPDPIKMLKDDHDEVKALFKEFESADGRSKSRIVKEAITKLTVHTMLEEEIFYPAFEKASGEENVVAEAEEEHQVVENLMKELKTMDRSGDEVHYDAKFTVMAENVKHHIEEEEKEMLPEAKKALKDQLDDLGMQMEKRKKELMSEVQKAPVR